MFRKPKLWLLRDVTDQIMSLSALLIQWETMAEARGEMNCGADLRNGLARSLLLGCLLKRAKQPAVQPVAHAGSLNFSKYSHLAHRKVCKLPRDTVFFRPSLRHASRRGSEEKRLCVMSRSFGAGEEFVVTYHFLVKNVL
jgi:hypothetical protein